MTLPNWLSKLDQAIFVLINHDTDHTFWDPVMIILRNPYTWIPLYSFLFYFALTRMKNGAWHFILMSLVTFAITDNISASVLKPVFERPRPCHDPMLQSIVRDLVGCGGVYSFPSSHAANHFGQAAFWFGSILAMTGKKWKWVFVWAGAISYAQVYVGVHYPLDVLAGGVFGLLVGMGTAKLFERLHNTEKRTRPGKLGDNFGEGTVFISRSYRKIRK
jgi:undecaprenyl-diphosphatase